MDQFRQSINDWERRHRKVHHAARYEYHSMMLQAGLEGGGGHRDHCSMSTRKRCARDVEAKKHNDNCTRSDEGRCRLTNEELKARAARRRKGGAPTRAEQARIRTGQRVRENATVKQHGRGAAERPKSRPALNPFWKVGKKNVWVSKRFCTPWGSVDPVVEAKTGFIDTNEEFPNVVKNFKKMMSQRLDTTIKTIHYYQPGKLTYFPGHLGTSIKNTVKGIWGLNGAIYFYVEGNKEWNVLKRVDKPWDELSTMFT